MHSVTNFSTQLKLRNDSMKIVYFGFWFGSEQQAVMFLGFKKNWIRWEFFVNDVTYFENLEHYMNILC